MGVNGSRSGAKMQNLIFWRFINFRQVVLSGYNHVLVRFHCFLTFWNALDFYYFKIVVFTLCNSLIAARVWGCQPWMAKS